MQVEEISDSAVDENRKMNKIDEMWSICHDCPYWEVCDPPYICEATEQKMKGENHDAI